ncbi:MAG: hypothetical protein AAF086_04185 [Planctomycetota bacterium]
MRSRTGHTASSRELTSTMALLAVAAAVCVTVTAGSGAAALQIQGTSDRRITAETDEAVASFMACLNEAAKTLAGQTAAVIESAATTLDLSEQVTACLILSDDRPVVSLQPHLSLLNLPPPAARS